MYGICDCHTASEQNLRSSFLLPSSRSPKTLLQGSGHKKLLSLSFRHGNAEDLQSVGHALISPAGLPARLLQIWPRHVPPGGKAGSEFAIEHGPTLHLRTRICARRYAGTTLLFREALPVHHNHYLKHSCVTVSGNAVITAWSRKQPCPWPNTLKTVSE